MTHTRIEKAEVPRGRMEEVGEVVLTQGFRWDNDSLVWDQMSRDWKYYSMESIFEFHLCTFKQVGVMKVTPDTQCTLVKQTSRQGNDHCFSEQECSQQCRTVQEQSCRTVSDRQCTTVNERQCATVNMQQCSTVNMQMCSTVSEQQCSTGELSNLVFYLHSVEH